MSKVSNKKKDAPQPLTPAVFHILLALTAGERHGLGIADDVEAATEGAMRLGPGTLYRSLKEMTRDRLIAEVAAPERDADPRRKFYRMTAAGRRVLRLEAERYEQVVRIAKGRHVLTEIR